VIPFELVLRYSDRSLARIADETERLLAGGPRTPPADAATLRAADPADVEVVRRFARRAGFTVVAVDEQTRRVQLEGPAAAVEQSFGVILTTAGPAEQAHREFHGSITLPAELRGVVVAVLNLSTKPVAFNR
jgi:hypothetical protein